MNSQPAEMSSAMSRGSVQYPSVAVIIPTLNEADGIGAVLAHLQAYAVETIVVDGGSEDGTVSLVQDLGVPVLVTAGGRSTQLNLGAAATRAEILLFLHGDTQLPPDFVSQVQQVLAQPGVVAGAFPLAIAGANWALRWVAWGANQRSYWLQLPYGDQGLFLRRSTFEAMGGFPPLPIMEDLVLVRSLQKQGRIGLAQTPVITSDRRWRKLGIWQTTLINQAMVVGYGLGLNPQTLADWYRRPRGTKS